MKTKLVFLNYASTEIAISPTSVPTLVPDKKMAALLDGDENPFFKIESINYPIEGSGGIYKEQFFDSFVSVMNDRPIPGSKRGHSYQSRPASDLYTVGARVDKQGDGSGTVHFKIYIPHKGDSDSNDGLIRDAKANIVNFSLVTCPKYTVEMDENNNQKYHFIESKGFERNDAVEYGAGAMKQTVNSLLMNGIITKAEANARRLIKKGEYDSASPWSFSATDGNKLLGEDKDDWDNYALWHLYEDPSAEEETKSRYKYPYGKNGKVFRSALRAIASRAAQQGLNDLSELASDLLQLMTEQQQSSKKGGRSVTKAEILAAIKNARDNNELTLKEVAQEMGLGNQLVTDEQKNAGELVAEFAELGIDDPVAAYKNAIEKVAETERARVENKIKETFDPQGLGDNNILFSYAKNQLGQTAESDLDESIKNFREDPIAQKLAGEMADGFSVANEIGVSEQAPKQKNSFGSAAALVL